MSLSVESEDWLREFSRQRWISFLFSDESVDGGSSFRSFKYASIAAKHVFTLNTTLIPLIFAQRRCAKIKGARNRPIFAHSAARKLKGARISENRQNHFLAISKPLIASRGGHFLS